MKHLRKYKLFESKSLNQSYFDILDVIQSVFDDFGIIQLPKEAEDELDNFLEEKIYTNMYWGFGVDGVKSSDQKKCYTSNPSDSSHINMICIWNVHHNDRVKIETTLREELDRMMKIAGNPVEIKYVPIVEYQEKELGDFSIEINSKD
jgi:hypothetical protein